MTIDLFNLHIWRNARYFGIEIFKIETNYDTHYSLFSFEYIMGTFSVDIFFINILDYEF